MITALALAVILDGTVVRSNGFIGAAFVTDLPHMAADLDDLIIAKVADEDCKRGKGEIVFRVTKNGRPYADQARVFTISAADKGVPSMIARALCAAGLKIVRPTH